MVLIPTAARLCQESNYNGYSDWYLPSTGELKLIFNSVSHLGIFNANRYWSSNDKDDKCAFYFCFKNGYGEKGTTSYTQKSAWHEITSNTPFLQVRAF
jgi:hypothetical protein